MAFSTLVKSYINLWLQKVNLRLETLTEENIERQRIEMLESQGYFNQAAFPIPAAFDSMSFENIMDDIALYQARFDDFKDKSQNDVEYSYNNDYFSTPDTEVLYTIVRKYKPKIILEVGSGHSTKIIRQAIIDGRIDSYLISVDPQPRTEIIRYTDEVYSQPIERVGNCEELFNRLNPGDILFIDSSHIIKTGNDVVFLYLNIIPTLSSGVLIHIHDVFLPYDYPIGWIADKGWQGNEHYLVQSMLSFGNTFEVLWAGYYFQRMFPDFAEYFPNLGDRYAQSIWLCKRE